MVWLLYVRNQMVLFLSQKGGVLGVGQEKDNDRLHRNCNAKQSDMMGNGILIFIPTEPAAL